MRICEATRVVVAALSLCLVFLVPELALGAQPTGLTAFHRSGQTFLTWNEDGATSGESYHVYSHTAAITAANLDQAILLTEDWGPLPEGSSFFYTERDREIGNSPYPGIDNYVISDLGAELDDATGFFVWTTAESGQSYYAVTTVTEGVENTVDFGAGNSLQSPVSESVADPSPVLVWESASGTSRVYTQFMDFASFNPTFERPNQGLQYAYNYWVGLPTADMCDGQVPDALPLYLHIEGFGSRYQVAEATTWGWCAIEVWADDPRQSWYYGFSSSHDYRGESAPSSGVIVNYTEARLLRAIFDTIRSPLYAVDEERIYTYGHSMGGSGALALGMRYPKVFAATYSSEPMTNYATSGDGGGVDWRDDTIPKWGSLGDNLPIENRGSSARHLAVYDGTGVWDWQNHQEQLVARLGDDMALISLAHGARDDVIEWSTQAVPVYGALYEGRRAFSGETLDLDHTWAAFGGMGPMLEDWRYRGPFYSLTVVRDETIPGLSFASGSSAVPPTGAGADYNMNLEWSASWNEWDGLPIDQDDRWQISLRSTDGSSQTVDVTPRRTQAFMVESGGAYRWENRSVVDNAVVASGVVTANSYGIVTVPKFGVTGDGNRLEITPRSGGNLPPQVEFSVSVAGLRATFTDQSSDQDGTIVGWSWTFGDGALSSSQHPIHDYPESGSYQVRLTVTDDGGATAFAEQTVVVDDDASSSPRFRRDWPITSRGIAVFNDQLAPNMSEAQVEFSASHYAGTQKMTRSEAERLRAVNPDFMILHYRLGDGLGYRGVEDECTPSGPFLAIIEGDQWVQEWPGESGVEENWFFHWPEMSSTRVLNCDWGWYLMDIGDLGYRQYWHDEVLRQLEANDNDGVFMDSLSVPNYLGADHFDPAFPWVDAAFESAWSERIEDWLDWLQGEDLGAYYLIPNVGQWITSRETTSYLSADGVMVEGFALQGSAEPYPVGDWRLQMNRILGLVEESKAQLLQSYAVWEEEHRMFILGSYLLVKGDRSYLNLEIDANPEWWPEYDIPIGAPVESAGSDIDSLLDANSGVYVREFDNGAVLVNPDPEATITVELNGAYHLLVAEGGGSVPASGVPGGEIETIIVTHVTMPPASAAVVLDEALVCSSPLSPPQQVTAPPTTWGVPRIHWNSVPGDDPDHYNIYRSSGGCHESGIAPVLIGEVAGGVREFVDWSIQDCVDYTYVITASDAGGLCESSYSDCASFVALGECGDNLWRRPSGRATSGP